MAIRFKYDTGSGMIASFAAGMAANRQRRRKYAEAVALQDRRHLQQMQNRWGIGIGGGIGGIAPRAPRVGGRVAAAGGKIIDPLATGDVSALKPSSKTVAEGDMPYEKKVEGRRAAVTARAKRKRRARLNRMGRGDEVPMGERLIYKSEKDLDREYEEQQARLKREQDMEDAKEIAEYNRDIQIGEAYRAGTMVLPEEAEKQMRELEDQRAKELADAYKGAEEGDEDAWEEYDAFMEGYKKKKRALLRSAYKPLKDPFEDYAAERDKMQAELDQERRDMENEARQKLYEDYNTAAEKYNDQVRAEAARQWGLKKNPDESPSDYMRKAAEELRKQGINPPQPPSPFDVTTHGAPVTGKGDSATAPHPFPKPGPTPGQALGALLESYREQGILPEEGAAASQPTEAAPVMPAGNAPAPGEEPPTSQPASTDTSNLPRPRTRAERDALDPGTKYIDRDGIVRTRPYPEPPIRDPHFDDMMVR